MLSKQFVSCPIGDTPVFKTKLCTTVTYPMFSMLRIVFFHLDILVSLFKVEIRELCFFRGSFKNSSPECQVPVMFYTKLAKLFTSEVFGRTHLEFHLSEGSVFHHTL